MRANSLRTLIAVVLMVAVLLSPCPARSAPVVRSGRIRTPTLCAQRLYRAWTHRDRAGARRVASKSAVDAMLKTRANGAGWRFEGCTRVSGGYDCFYWYEGGGANMRVTGSRSKGYRVQSIRFVAD
jgi:hypothetical protein